MNGDTKTKTKTETEWVYHLDSVCANILNNIPNYIIIHTKESPVLFPKGNLTTVHSNKMVQVQNNFWKKGGKHILDVPKMCHQKELKASALDISASLPIVKPSQESKVNVYVYAQSYGRI